MDRLISLQAAIDALKNISFSYWFECGEYLSEDTREIKIINSNKALEEIESLPSAQPEPQWIPCSETENLPEHEVLCCDRYGEELIGWLSCKDDQWLCESEGEMMYDPIAWREKPEPWRGEK